MKMLLAVPVCGQYEIGRISLYQWDQLTSPETDFLLIDNTGLESPYGRWQHRYQMNRWWTFTNSENVGLVRSCQMAYEIARDDSYDLLCLSHNDVWLYQEYWDRTICSLFKNIPKLGGVGLFGSKGCGREGHRLDTFGSLIEMDGHGRKMERLWEPATTFDGFFMAFSMQMLKEAGGFDQRYEWHHIYDLDASLTSIKLGYRNVVVNIPCHHLSGLTANNDAYATSGPDVHQANSKRFLDKWKGDLGVTVDEDFNYRWGL